MPNSVTTWRGSEIFSSVGIHRRQHHFVTLRCGSDLQTSRTLQLAALTAATPEALIGLNTPRTDEGCVIFGDATAPDGSLRVTFDGWTAKIGPADAVERLPEREYCSLSGILAAAISISELFLSFPFCRPQHHGDTPHCWSFALAA